MSCCNHECSQGRKCPSKASNAPLTRIFAVVAVVIATAMYMAFVVYVG